ncbi:hypothetical protein ACFL1H_05360 [Nanoarchaeota archaeon]
MLMMKCQICKKKISETFLKKILGTYIKNEKGKRLPICFECQKTLSNNKKEMLEKIK